MKKLIAILCLLLALVCVLVACDSTQTPSTGDDTPNDAHTHAFGEWSVSKAATCGAKGEEKRTCPCGESETREIAATGEHTWGDWIVIVNATCGSKGAHMHVCACGASATEEIPATGEHSFGGWSISKAATCGAKGEETRSCTCGKSETRELAIAPNAHSFGEWSVSKAATCGAKGEEKRSCACGAFETREILATGAHSYVNGVCRCGAQKVVSNDFYTRTGNKIYFGTYPQSKVTDGALITTLNVKAGALPTSESARAWTSYGYYVEGETGNYMWYIDLVEGGEKYRGVYFTAYRPYGGTYDNSPSVENTYQDDNGYTPGTVYWFKYEPIAWTVLQEEGGKALLLCDMIIDAQAYQNERTHRTDGGSGMYDSYNASSGVPSGTLANNYAYSTIRAWLNDTFYETAFSDLLQEIILMTTVDNGVESTGYESNECVCENTQDKVFLLSAKEVTMTEYGFTTEKDKSDIREKQTTAYAQAQGAYTYEHSGSGFWRLRSPLDFSISARYVDYDGSLQGWDVDSFEFGIVPALQIRLD